MGELSEALLGSIPVGAEEDQERLRPLDLAAEGPLPVSPRRDAAVFVKVKKWHLETVLQQPVLHAGGGGFVPFVTVRMGQEYASQDQPLK